MATRVSSSPATGVTKQRTRLRSELPVAEYSEINVPGTYVLDGSGLLIRVPTNGVLARQSPIIGVVGKGPILARQLSEDPWIPIGEARAIAAKHNCHIDF